MPGPGRLASPHSAGRGCLGRAIGEPAQRGARMPGPGDWRARTARGEDAWAGRWRARTARGEDAWAGDWRARTARGEDAWAGGRGPTDSWSLATRGPPGHVLDAPSLVIAVILSPTLCGEHERTRGRLRASPGPPAASPRRRPLSPGANIVGAPLVDRRDTCPREQVHAQPHTTARMPVPEDRLPRNCTPRLECLSPRTGSRATAHHRSNACPRGQALLDSHRRDSQRGLRA
jgi:hypothetical protein